MSNKISSTAQLSPVNCSVASTTVERALQIHLFLTNKANFQKSQMNVTFFITEDYGKMDTWSNRKNKAKTKPIQSQYKPNTNPIYPVVASGEAGSNPIYPVVASGEAGTNPIYPVVASGEAGTYPISEAKMLNAWSEYPLCGRRM